MVAFGLEDLAISTPLKTARMLSKRIVLPLFFTAGRSTHNLRFSENRRDANLPGCCSSRKRYSRHCDRLWPPKKFRCRPHDFRFPPKNAGFEPFLSTRRNFFDARQQCPSRWLTCCQQSAKFPEIQSYQKTPAFNHLCQFFPRIANMWTAEYVCWM